MENLLSSILPPVGGASPEEQANDDEYDMDCSDGFIVPHNPLPEVSGGREEGESLRDSSTEDVEFYSEGDSEGSDAVFERGVSRTVQEPEAQTPVPPTTTTDILERMAAERGRRSEEGSRRDTTVTNLFPPDTSLFESYMEPSGGAEPAVVSSKENWPVSMVMLVNVPASIIKGSGPMRKLLSMNRSTKGLTRLKLLELISHTCFNASNEPEEERAATRGASRRGRRVPPAPPPSPRGEGGGGLSADSRRLLTIINNEESRRGLGGGGEHLPAGTFCHTYTNEGGNEVEIQVPCTTQYVEAVRSKGLQAYLEALRFWFIIHDPSFSVVDEMERIMKTHKKGAEKAMRNKNQGSIRTKYASPVNWKVYRSVQTAKAYGHLLDAYHNEGTLSARTQTSIRGMPPEMAFRPLGDEDLLRGLDPSAVESVCEYQHTLSNYFITDPSTHEIRLTGLKKPDMGRELRELERSELAPEKLVEIAAPSNKVHVDPTTGRILPRGGSFASGDGDDGGLSSMLSRFRLGEEEGEPSNYETLHDRRNSEQAMFGGFDGGTKEYRAWDADEVDEIEDSNKALRHKERNHYARVELRRLYMMSDPPRYIQELKELRIRAAKELIADIRGFRDEKESWYDAVVRILQFGESLPADKFWPAFAMTCDNLGVFGNAMVQEYASFIDAFRIQPGWKPRDLQKYLVISLNVLEYEFCLHLHALLSGAAQTGKSFLIQKLMEMRVSKTVEKITTMTENSLTSDPRAFNYKTVVMEEASGWCLGMDQDGKPTAMQSSILKDILTSCTANSLRCNWQDGETSRSETFAVMMTNFIFASNWGYPPKNTPLVSRLLVEDVADDEGKKIPVAEIAFALTGQTVTHLSERICKEKKIEQYMHLLVELFILAEVINPKVNLDIPLFLMEDVFSYLKEHHDVPSPSIRFREQFLKTCRVLTIQNAIRSAYFTEAGQLKYQYETKPEFDRTGEPTGRRLIVTDDKGNPIKKGFDITTLPDAIEPLLFCTEDIFAYAMTMLEGHIIPKLEADVINSLSLLLLSTDKEHRFLRSKTISPSAILFAQTTTGGAAPGLGTSGGEDGGEGGGYATYQQQRVKASMFDPHYYVLRFPSLEAFYRETASHSEKNICETTVRTIVDELKDRSLSITMKPTLLQYQSGSDLISGVDPISFAMTMERGEKKKKIPFIRIEKYRHGGSVAICIAKDLVEEEEVSGEGGVPQEEGTRHNPVPRARRKTLTHYQQAMRNALEYALSYSTTRPRDIVLSKSYAPGPKQVYHELLDVIHVEPKPRILYRQQGLVSGLLGPLLVYYTGDESNDYMGMGADLVVVDDNFELEVAKNHARWIGREFDPSVLPAVQDKLIKRVRQQHPTLFSNDTITYPEDARYIVDTQGAKSTFVRKRVANASTFEEIDALMAEPYMKTRKLCNYFDKVGEEEEESTLTFETAAMRVASEMRSAGREMGEDEIYQKYTATLDAYESEAGRMRLETQRARDDNSTYEFSYPSPRPVPEEEQLDPVIAERNAAHKDLHTRLSNVRHDIDAYNYATRQSCLEAMDVLEQDYDQAAQQAYDTTYGTVHHASSSGTTGSKRSAGALERLNQFRKDEEAYRNRHRARGNEEIMFVPSFSREAPGSPLLRSEEGCSERGERPGHAAVVAADLLNRDVSREAFSL